MTVPKFLPGDVVTWRWGAQDDGILYSGTVKSADQLLDGRLIYWMHLSANKVLESDIVSLLHRPSPPPVRDRLREAGYPWMHDYFCGQQYVKTADGENAGFSEGDHIADRIVALSRLPEVLHEIESIAANYDLDADAGIAMIRGTARRALESVGVNL